MLENIPSQSAMIELLGPSLYEITGCKTKTEPETADA